MKTEISDSRKCSLCGAALEAPGGHCPACLLQLGLAQDGDGESAGASTVGSQADQRIGRYQLLQPLGEGGYGTVYLAEQEQPVRRRVAVKVIKLGMDTKQVIARFEAERQVLALMDHPNIARVIDAGATETGRPYFVMELVRGIKITEYCDQHGFSIRQRLDLFLPVCQAIQHAHQKGVVHRDIKPSNVLVAEHDGAPTPKIIDFGIAKATTDEALGGQTVFTAFEQFIGTPACMSPEQAGMGGLDIDTRSDIYSLGALLYELLAGRPVFSASELHNLALDEILKLIREKEPPQPSDLPGTLPAADLAEVAQRRRTEPVRLTSQLRGDLDCIVMKALEKDRTRRYETAGALAADIQRHLNCEPVAARPPGKFYRFQKLVRRHRIVFAAASAVTVALIAGLAVSTWLYVKERRALERAVAAEQAEIRLRARAESDEKKAETEASKSDQVAKFLQDMIRGAGPSVALGRDTALLRDILDRTSERVGKDLKDQPEVEAELRNTIGEVYRVLGEYNKAEAMQRQALAMRRALFGEMHPKVAYSLNDLGIALWNQDKMAEAESVLREALAAKRAVFGNEHISVATTLSNLGMVLWSAGRLAEAESTEREALAMRRKLLGDDSADVVTSLNNLGFVLRDQGKLAEAEATDREALAMRRRLLGDTHPAVASSLGNLAIVLRNEGKLAEAEELDRQALELNRKLLSDGHPDMASSLYNLAQVLRDEGKSTEAEPIDREYLAGYEKRLPDDWHTFNARSLLGGDLLGQMKYADAEPLLASGYEGMKAREAHIPAREKARLEEALHRLVALYEATGQPEKAEEWKSKLASAK